MNCCFRNQTRNVSVLTKARYKHKKCFSLSQQLLQRKLSLKASKSSSILTKIICNKSLHRDSDVSENGEKKPLALKWYTCGPTVYDQAHLGHARNYVSTDVIRRILENHFSIPTDFALGITDIDDKIITRAKENGTLMIICFTDHCTQFK